jgi:hypothetical protein
MAKKLAKKKNVGKLPKLNIKKVKINRDKSLLVGAVMLAVVLFGVSGWVWWTRVFTDETRVFNDMLNNSLSSSSVARSVEEKNQQSGVDQNTYVSFRAPEVVSQTRTILSEKTMSRRTTTVTTETVGTAKTDYVRYVSAEGAEELSVAGNLDKVIGVWGKREPDTGLGESATFLNEAVFSIVPFGNLTPDGRSELLNMILEKNVYDIKTGSKNFEEGRYVYSYQVSLDPKAYVEILAKYVELTGIGDNSQLDAANYENSPPVILEMKVDILSRQLMSIQYLATGRTEKIVSRNLYRDVKTPSETIPFDELQSRLTGQPAGQNTIQ